MSDFISANSTVQLMMNSNMRKALRLRVSHAIENSNIGVDKLPVANASVLAVNVLVELTGLDAHYWMEDI